MKRFFIFFITLVLVTGCTLPWSQKEDKFIIPPEHTFTNDSHRAIKVGFDSYREFHSSLMDIYEKIMPSGYDNSKIRVSAIVPGQGSGELSIVANAVRNVRLGNFGSTFDIHALVQSLTNDNIDIRTSGEIISNIGQYYFHLDSLDLTGSGQEYESGKEDIQKFTTRYAPYFKKWIMLTPISLNKIVATSPVNILPSKFHDTMNRFGTMYQSMTQDLFLGGFKFQEILFKNHIFREVASLGKDNNAMYQYTVALDMTGVLDFAQDFSLQYSGTGLLQTERESIQSFLDDLSFSGTLGFHESDSRFFSFVGDFSLSGSQEKIHIDYNYGLTEGHIILTSTDKGEFFHASAKNEGAKVTYTIVTDKKQVLNATLTRNAQNQFETFDANAGSGPEKFHTFLSWKEKKDFVFQLSSVGTGTGDMVNINLEGSIPEGTLRSLSGGLNLPDGKLATLHYIYNQDENITGDIQQGNINITLDGHYKKDDIHLDVSLQGMPLVTLESKKDEKNLITGYVQLPVAKITWNAQEKGDFFETLNIQMQSPVAQGALDMKTIDGWLSGKLIVKSSQVSTSIPPIDIRAQKSSPKDFSLRIDANIPSISTDPIVSQISQDTVHFEWDSTVDIRWDKEAKKDIPKDLLLLEDVMAQIKKNFPESTTLSKEMMPSDL